MLWVGLFVAASLFVSPVATAGKILAWGMDLNGEVSAAPTGNEFRSITAGANHAAALDGNGTVYAWGDDTDGQISNSHLVHVGTNCKWIERTWLVLGADLGSQFRVCAHPVWQQVCDAQFADHHGQPNSEEQRQ